MKIEKVFQTIELLNLFVEKIKKDYSYSNLNEKNITDDKKFWTTVTHFFGVKFYQSKE